MKKTLAEMTPVLAGDGTLFADAVSSDNDAAAAAAAVAADVCVDQIQGCTRYDCRRAGGAADGGAK